MYKKKAFTLIELLVVISIIALLISILMPALNKAREQATGTVCLGNQKALIMAYIMYADENEDRVVGSDFGVGLDDPKSKYAWVKVPLKPFDATLGEKKEAIRAGLLWPYINAIDVYHCPGDRRELKPQTTFRSYSIVGGLNGVLPKGQWGCYPIHKLAQLKRPSSKYVFVEESDPRGVNCGVWIIYAQPDERRWVDPVAIWHNKRSTLAFADGHAEMITWVDKSTIEMAELQVFMYPAPEGNDLDFMKRGYPSAGMCDNMGW